MRNSIHKTMRRLFDILQTGGVWVFVLFTTLNINAQCPAENNAFKGGEQLDYEMYFNWKFVWVKAGTSRLKTDDIVLSDGTRGYFTVPSYSAD